MNSYYTHVSEFRFFLLKPFDILIDNINQSQKLGTLTSIYHQMRLKSSSNDENSKRIFRILYLAKLLVETDHGEVALEMLEQLNEEKKNRQYHPFEKPHAAARHLMDVAVLKGDINLVQHIHQSLSSSSLFVMDSDLLSPLIKVHMQRLVLLSFLPTVCPINHSTFASFKYSVM